MSRPDLLRKDDKGGPPEQLRDRKIGAVVPSGMSRLTLRQQGHTCESFSSCRHQPELQVAGFVPPHTAGTREMWGEAPLVMVTYSPSTALCSYVLPPRRNRIFFVASSCGSVPRGCGNRLGTGASVSVAHDRRSLAGHRFARLLGVLSQRGYLLSKIHLEIPESEC